MGFLTLLVIAVVLYYLFRKKKNPKQKKTKMEEMGKAFNPVRTTAHNEKDDESDLVSFRKSEVEETFTKAGNHSGYKLQMFHKGLKETKYITARYMDILEEKEHKQVSQWEKKWERVCTEREAQEKADKAAEITNRCKAKLKAAESILEQALDIDSSVVWNKLKKDALFSKEKPKEPRKPPDPPEPKLEQFAIPTNFFDEVFSGGRQKLESQNSSMFNKAHQEWETECLKIQKEYSEVLGKYKRNLFKWTYEKNKHELEITKQHAEVDDMRRRYLNKESKAIEEACKLVLRNSLYPDEFPRKFDLEFNEANGMLIVDFQLPNLDQIPNQTTAKYIKSKDAIEMEYLSKSDHEKLYETVIYQMTLRTLYELFKADIVDRITAVTFNGFVTSVNTATGNKTTKCIISLQAEKEEFEEINLALVDPKACFKSLKGVGSPKMSALTPVPPLVFLDKSDKRFIDHYEVAESLDNSTNLASMDWEDFEHLVRELFEKEFTISGGEVKITQSSRDGGVDAVVFDPDPIRGGKIVIQAKRYTNTVGVSAVRDLYGTVVNEGAIKGILVSTADFGTESYNFAKGKPLTLLNGGNLLSLLEKHGHNARIDIAEARRLRNEQLK